MKKFIYLLLALLLMLTGCTESNEHEIGPLSVGMFSFTAVEAYYDGETDGVFRSGFRNTEPTTVENAEQARALAKNECIVKYDAVVVSYDDNTKMYCVCFYTEGRDGGDQLVYMDSNGITKLVVCG